MDREIEGLACLDGAGPGHRPFTAATAVQIRYGIPRRESPSAEKAEGLFVFLLLILGKVVSRLGLRAPVGLKTDGQRQRNVADHGLGSCFSPVRGLEEHYWPSSVRSVGCLEWGIIEVAMISLV